MAPTRRMTDWWSESGIIHAPLDGGDLGAAWHPARAIDDDDEIASRLADCWNACAGIANPSAVAELVEAARKTVRRAEKLEIEYGDHFEVRVLRATLAKLDGA